MDEPKMDNGPKNYKIVGGIIVGLGCLMLINLLAKIISIDFVSEFWPALIIVTGFMIMISSIRNAPIGIIMVLAGMMLVAAQQGWLDTTFGHILEAITVILIGILLLLKIGGK